MISSNTVIYDRMGESVADARVRPPSRGAMRSLPLAVAGALLLAFGASGPCAAGQQPALDIVGKVASLPPTPQPHWLWVYDANLSSMPDGRAILIDGDSGAVLGMLSTGFSFIALTLPNHYRALYSAETYYSRTTRGTRTDVVTFYDPVKLEPVEEVVLPTKRASTIPRFADAALTDDDRFMAVFNLTPASSLSIVDVEQRRFAGEIDTPGCTMAYAAGPRRLLSLCSDGSVLSTHLDDQGQLRKRERTAGFFTLDDPIIESGVRAGNVWSFISFQGWVYSLTVEEHKLTFAKRWSLLDAADRKADWQSGGMLPIALHEATGRLYVLMYQGQQRNHKLPGTEVWVYDMQARKRVQRIPLGAAARSIQVTQDDQPLLFALPDAAPVLEVMDALSGEHLRTVTEVGIVPILMQSPWVRSMAPSRTGAADTRRIAKEIQP